MKFPGGRAVSAVAVALASLSLGATGAVAASASAATEPACDGADCPGTVPVSLAASQGSLNLTQLQLENLSATAVDARTGEPLPGLKIRFYTVGGRFLGSSYTDYDGMAGISASENLGPGTAQELLGGYQAVLLGDGVHTTATAHAAITVGTDCFTATCPPGSDRRLKLDVVPVDWSRSDV